MDGSRVSVLRAYKHLVFTVAWGCLSILVAGCAMISSHPTAELGRSPDGTTAAGSYFLAKHHMKVLVTKDARGRQQLSINVVAVPDRRHLIDTGLNLSPYSDDDIKVTLAIARGLVPSVFSVIMMDRL